ncbi:hypothetical protein FLAG1_07117 [Fusarium langsethiae]|uniref:Uncharacterized protein n=1 Tax=Fusarium langsethiae TaxID=179993 RepID=A0A0M9EU84_FUSLA|nr:hypothetical protein FLAG1_07117 [Fusarium langsethiae]GKU04418.1 unnamed protein product [Fusarium langsethiae]GKU20182.1 unnamed protein product [Fusarium langsethiae]
MPGDRNPLYQPRAPYYIPQLHNPMRWTQDIGLSRPDGWHTANAGVFASFKNLYRSRKRYSYYPNWHHWIYLSENKSPLNETWNQDPWDEAFLELLEYRDKHEPLGRSNFNYIGCPKSFLCAIWRISGPALLHFTNEPVDQDITQQTSRGRILDPVSVRVFELPMTEIVIPGRFPTRFEQIRSITASNSTYWTTRTTYSNFEQVRGQALKVLKKYEEGYPLTYGMLAKAEDKLTRLLAVDDTILIVGPRLVSFLAATIPSHYGAKWLGEVKIWWRKRQHEKPTKEDGSQTKANRAARDPVADQLQWFIDGMTDDDKEKFQKTHRGELLLRRIQKGLENKDWDGRDDIMKQIEDALGRP